MEDRTQPCANCRCLAIRVPHLLRKLWRGLGALWLVVLLCLPCWAGWPDARIVRLADGGSASFVQLGSQVVLLSCAHRDATHAIPRGERIEFECNDGSRGMATVAAVAKFDIDGEPLSDSAILTFEGHPSPNVTPLPISKRPLRTGEQVWVAGFPMGRYNCRTTTVKEDGGTLWLNGQSTPGESGGPIINSSGEIVGTLTATTSDGMTMCCGRQVISPFTTDYCPGGMCPSGQCQGYSCPLPPRQPQPVPRPPVAAPQPTPPRNCECVAKIEKLTADITSLRAEIAALKTAGANQPNCDAACDKVRDELNQKIETLAAAQVNITNEIKNSATPNYDAIAAEVAKRLPPINFRIKDQRGPEYSTEYQPARLGSYVTLPFGPAH